MKVHNAEKWAKEIHNRIREGFGDPDFGIGGNEEAQKYFATVAEAIREEQRKECAELAGKYLIQTMGVKGVAEVQNIILSAGKDKT